MTFPQNTANCSFLTGLLIATFFRFALREKQCFSNPHIFKNDTPPFLVLLAHLTRGMPQPKRAFPLGLLASIPLMRFITCCARTLNAHEKLYHDRRSRRLLGDDEAQTCDGNFSRHQEPQRLVFPQLTHVPHPLVVDAPQALCQQTLIVSMCQVTYHRHSH